MDGLFVIDVGLVDGDEVGIFVGDLDGPSVGD